MAGSWRKNHSRSLHAAERDGKQIVCSVPPYVNEPVVYRPKATNDPTPWTVPMTGLRLNGSKCHIVEKEQ